MAQKTASAAPSRGQSLRATPSTTTDAPDAVAPSQPGTTPHSTDPTSTPVDKASVNEPDQTRAQATSQPMSKTTSTGSNLSGKDATAETASPYGTRSRYRTGSSRPNYAEDKDIDVDMYDIYPEKKEPEPKKSSRHANQSATSTHEHSRPNGSSRKTASADDSKTHLSSHGSKDATVANASGTSQNATHSSNAPASKKRKAAAAQSSSASASQSQTPAPAATTSGGTSRRSAPTASQTPNVVPETNMLSFSDARLKDGALVADDGTSLRPNDNVYLVCEPPGEPYYLGRIMEFLHVQNDQNKPVDAIRINWFYRPKDIGKKVNDTRLVFATMHSDISPLTSLRGKCLIRHKAEIPAMSDYRKTPDCFWYEKLYDRYIQKNYDLIPTSQIVNVPEKVKKVLDERWKFIIVEQGRGKEFTSAVKLCKRCSGYCASNDSVDCAVCKNTYHMNCVRPPLLKKPSRGFAWSCAACSRAQERKLEARHTPNMVEPAADADDDELYDEEEEDIQGVDTGQTSPANADDDDTHRTGTAEQIYQASLWPWRYLGMHCKPEDALDYDDRIYPRASTRVGPRHQATVLPWPGRPVQYMKPLEYKRSGKKDSKMSKEAQAAYEAEKARREKLPKWFQDEPPGYVARGEDCDSDDPGATATLLWKPPPAGDNGQEEKTKIDQYMSRAKEMAIPLGLPENSTNLLDVALETYMHSGYSADRALKVLSETEKAAFKEPDLTPAEQKKFEEAVSKYGSELQLITRHIKTVPYGAIVRYYYTWKKTKQGRQIWGNFRNRKGKKEAKKAEAAANKLQDDIADDADDSAFDAEKAAQKKKAFICKFCHTKSSRQWRRAPNASNAMVTETGGKSTQKDKNDQYIQALCRRCAELWRRYAIQWEDLEEVARKLAQSGNRAWKRKQDEELLKELLTANELLTATYGTPEPSNQPTPASASNSGAPSGEPPRKKLKGVPADKESDPAASDAGTAPAPQTKKKEKAVEKPAAPAVPEIPKPKTMPCAICDQLEPLGDQHLSCRECRMTVHRNCYGVVDSRASGKWTCDMCMNDKNPQVSIHYKCVLCPVEYTEHDFVEAPKPSTHKKKSEKEKERERLEREQAQKAAEYYKKKQEELNRPTNPREPLKRTADNNWVHVTCAVWTPEVKFGTAKALSPSEGISSIPRVRYDEVCKACGHKGGACVSCHHCKVSVHVECARQKGYLLGFDITPVKGSRRDQHSIVTINGETGAMSAAIWCKEHVPTKTIVHRMHDIVNDNGQNALQLYVQSCKQADLTLTGTVRKANLITNATKMASAPITTGARRASTTNLPAAVQGLSNGNQGDSTTARDLCRICITCGIDTTPRWYRISESDERDLANGHYGTEAQKFIEQRKFQCHKCRKAGRRPNPHPPREPSPPEEPHQVPPPMPLAQTPLAAPISLRSPPPLLLSEPRRTSTSYPWGGPVVPPPQHASGPGGPPSVTAAAAAAAVAPMQVPGPPPAHPHHPAAGAGMAYGAPGPRYPDWHGQAHAQHGSPSPRQVNGGPAGVQAGGPLGNLSALRPPPMSMPPGSPLPPGMPNGHHGPAVQNGLLPSPPHRVDGHPPPMPHSSSFGHPFHHNLPPSHVMPNGGPLPPPPPSRGPESFPQGLMAQRAPFQAPHGSPPGPAPRDGPLTRESRETSGPLGTPNIRPSAPPRPAGASTSPSLRNLLS
ncbi:hypothetical protein ACRALDRAFT_1039744 [Sodiomyces alcalophilus JCM 7366]|uniref:uncharacterized protein n=1 Tax=Sodiomyces alcalophilus JCM 7366 TaxID=591952 RepID=UPI0039B67848